MSAKFASQIDLFNHYKKRYSYFEYRLHSPFSELTKYAIVIPCYNEPDLIGTLQSLADAEIPDTNFEVIIVLNGAVDASQDLIDQNNQTLAAFRDWKNDVSVEKINFQLINATNLPSKKAGVGLARKIGMDEAFRQFAAQDTIGHIICLDADCTVSTNYLKQAESQLNSAVRGGHFQFEHRLPDVENEKLKEGIINYELHLRYHNQGLNFTGFPLADHTIGSCMIVRSDVYGLLGGMNQRKAGEDFYFLNKVYMGGNCITLHSAFVYPSSRISDRVPFGTGKAQGHWVMNSETDYFTYSPKIYKALKEFILLSQIYRPVDLTQFNINLQPFLKQSDFIKHRNQILAQSKSLKSFHNNLFQWCDAFYLLKLIHFLRDHHFPNTTIKESAFCLLSWLDIPVSNINSITELLSIYREIERR